MEDKGQQWHLMRNKGEYEDNDDERQQQGTMLNKRVAGWGTILKDNDKDNKDKDWVYISFFKQSP